MRRALGLWAGVLLLAAADSSAAADTIIDFENLEAGTVVSDLLVVPGVGPVRVTGLNPRFPGDNAAVIFDSSRPTGNDPDLGSPNGDFELPGGGRGPGLGSAGRRGQPCQNAIRLGKILIVEEHLDTLSGGKIPNPDDEGQPGGRLEFDFSALGWVTVDDIRLIDVEEPDAELTFVHADGTTSRVLVHTGDNGVADLSEMDPTLIGPDCHVEYPDGRRPPFRAVRTLRVAFNGSGGIDNIVLRPALKLEKSTNGFEADRPNDGEAPAIAPGGAVTWRYEATNLSDEPLRVTSLTDDRLGEITNRIGGDADGDGQLGPAETWIYEVVGTAQRVSSLPEGTRVRGRCGGRTSAWLYENTATVRAVDRTGSELRASDPSHYCNPGEPPPVRIRIRKQERGADRRTLPAGSDVTFEIEVTNGNDFELTDVVVSDEQAPGCGREIGTMAPRTSERYECVVPAAELPRGEGGSQLCVFENVVRVRGEGEGGQVLTDYDPSTVEFVDVAIKKKAEALGPEVKVSIWVENTGACELEKLRIVDPLAPACNREIGPLAPGATEEIVCTARLVNEACVEAWRGKGKVEECAEAEIEIGDGKEPGVEIPDFVGWPVDDAVAECERVGLVPEVSTRRAWAGSGKVIDQEPAAGVSVPAGSLVKLVAAKGIWPGCLIWLLLLLLLLLFFVLVRRFLSGAKRVLLVANTNPNALELHKKNCHYAQLIDPENRFNITGTRSLENEIYKENRTPPPSVVAEWQRKGYDGCFHCLRELHTGARGKAPTETIG